LSILIQFLQLLDDSEPIAMVHPVCDDP